MHPESEAQTSEKPTLPRADLELVGRPLFFFSVALILGASFVLAYFLQATPLDRIVWPAPLSEAVLVLVGLALIALLPRFPLRRSTYLLLGTGLLLFYLGMLQEVMEEIFGPIPPYPLFEYLGLPFGIALAIVGIGRSIYLAQRQASELDYHFRALTEGLSEVVYQADPITRAPLWLNSAAEGVFGYPPEVLIDRPAIWNESVYPDDQEEVHRRLAEARGEKRPISLEYRVVRPGGEVRWVEDRVHWERDHQGGIRFMKGIIYDITDRKQAEANIRAERDFSRALLENMPGLFFLFDRSGRLRFWNRNVEQISGLSADALPGTTPSQFFPGSPGEELEAVLAKGVEQAYTQMETSLRTVSGRDIPYALEVRRVTVAGERHWLTFGLDLSHHKEYQAEIERLAYWDTITGLPNWTYLMEELNRELDRNQDRNQFAGLLFLDIDNFKSVNDSLGHEAGDELLSRLTQRLQSRLLPNDLLARIGGDELAVLLPELGTGELEAARRAEELMNGLQNALQEPLRVGSRDLIISASMGITLFSRPDRKASDLIQEADTALYAGKHKGKGEHAFFQPEMRRSAQEQLHLEQELRQAFEAGDLALHYQPIVALADGGTVGFEALLRWNHPTEGWISPARFIPVAEQSGLIRRLGAWVLRQGVQQWRLWEGDTGESALPFGLSVNVSAHQFAQPQFADQVAAILEETGVAPDRIILELTESTLLEDPEGAAEKLLALSQRGLRFAIDDFGTGYSSLSYLKQLPIHTIKIDKSFIQDLAQNPSSQVLVQTILAMAGHLGMTVVAEGVETQEGADWLRQQGCDFAQGFLFNHPLPAGKATEALSGG